MSGEKRQNFAAQVHRFLLPPKLDLYAFPISAPVHIEKISLCTMLFAIVCRQTCISPFFLGPDSGPEGSSQISVQRPKFLSPENQDLLYIHSWYKMACLTFGIAPNKFAYIQIKSNYGASFKLKRSLDLEAVFS